MVKSRTFYEIPREFLRDFLKNVRENFRDKEECLGNGCSPFLLFCSRFFEEQMYILHGLSHDFKN